MKNGGKVLSIFFLSIIVMSLFAFLTSAETPLDILINKISGPTNLVNAINQQLGSDTQAAIAKVLFFILIALIIYSISDVIPFISNSNNAIKWGVTLIISFLAIWFLQVGDIILILTSYKALGVAITTVIPLIVLIAFNYKLRSQGSTYAGIINKITMTLFILYVGFSWLTTDTAFLGQSNLWWIYPVTIIIAFIWLFAEGWIYYRIFLSKERGSVQAFNTVEKVMIATRIKNLMERKENADQTEAKTIDSEIKRLEKRLNESP